MIKVTDNPEIYCLGSGSTGNAYILKFTGQEGTSQILVEAGLSYKEIVKRASAQRQKISRCQACLVTHAHGDHAMAARTINDAGIPVYASRSTLADPNVGIAPTERNTLEDWTPKYITRTIVVLPFLVEHDAPESMGFVIKETTSQKAVLFINDCRTTRADLSQIPIDVAMVECNYHNDTLAAAMEKAEQEGDRIQIKRYGRIRNWHMGLNGTRILLDRLNLKRAETIILMHLSKQNSREEDMRRTIQLDHPACRVYTAQELGGFN